MQTVEIDLNNIESILGRPGTVIIDAWASWCGPCRAFAPIFEAAARRHPEVVWGKLDTEKQPELASAFEVRAIPTLLVLRDGVLVAQQAGMLPGSALDEIVSKVQALDMAEVRRQVEAKEHAHAQTPDPAPARRA